MCDKSYSISRHFADKMNGFRNQADNIDSFLITKTCKAIWTKLQVRL
jgi:hypothetical protein